jgi:beta-barrel assembly-enhancing protease
MKLKKPAKTRTSPKPRTSSKRKKASKKTILIIVLAVCVLAGGFIAYKIISNKDNISNAISASADAISSAAEEINPEQEYYIGRAVAARLLSTYNVYTKKPALTVYLNNICAAITVNSPYPYIYNGYHVVILDSNEINAFATPGGHIYVTLALVNAAKTEEELAGVIAHEIAHIQLKHSIKAIKNSRFTQALLVTGTAVAGTAGGMDVKHLTDALNDSFMEIVQTLVNNGYSQDQEFDADSTAMSLMAGAGYNPSGLINLLMTLGAVQTSDSGFGKTHPNPADRIVNAQKSISKYKDIKTSAARQKRFTAAKK